MRSWMFYTLMVSSSLFWQCEPPVQFSGAQPKGVDQRYTFEEAHQGIFYCASDSAWVLLTPNTLYKEKAYSFFLDRAEFESEAAEQSYGDQVFLKELNQYAEINYVNDSMLFCTTYLRDTLFSVDKDHVLKMYKGRYVLNTRLTNENWDVKLLSVDAAGDLTLEQTKYPDDLRQLQAITSTEDISYRGREQVLINPTKIEFKKLLKTKLIFEECNFFERVLRRTPI